MLNMNSIFLGGDSYKREYPPFTKYKMNKRHINHPVTIWMRQSLDNSLWAIEHGLALEGQFITRYGHGHNSAKAIRWARDFGTLPQRKGLTPFAICVRDDLKTIDPVESYRRSYCFDKASFASWDKGVLPPTWFKPYRSL